MFASLCFIKILLLLSNLDLVFCKTASVNPVESPLKIGAFNVQKLGNSKLKNEDVMKIVRKVLLRYDIVLLQEIVTTDTSLMDNLLKDLNKMTSSKTTYSMAISERLGRGVAKEQYAYLYKSDKLDFLDGLAYPDPFDDFMRPPFIAHFSTPTLRDMTSLIFIGIHTQPKNAANETSALADCYDYAVKRYKQKNAIIMGDMNAGCSNVRISDWDNIDLWTREEFTWLITHDTDTTLSSNCCPYDRIVTAGSGMEEAVIWSTVLVFNFREAFGLSTEQALLISDHWPIEVQLIGKVSKEVDNYITPRVCVTIDDSREHPLPQEIQQQRTIMGFAIERTESSTTLFKVDSDSDALLTALGKFGTKYPQFVSREQVAAATYKVLHSVLNDDSSHYVLEEESFSVLIEYDNEEMTTSIHFCSETTVN